MADEDDVWKILVPAAEWDALAPRALVLTLVAPSAVGRCEVVWATGAGVTASGFGILGAATDEDACGDGVNIGEDDGEAKGRVDRLLVAGA